MAIKYFGTTAPKLADFKNYRFYWLSITIRYICKYTSQIISPVDKNIQKSITEHLEPENGVWDTENIYSNNLLINPLVDLYKRYNNFVEKMLFPDLEKKDTNIIFTYTPMHGVGYPYIKNVFENAKFNVSINKH